MVTTPEIYASCPACGAEYTTTAAWDALPLVGMHEVDGITTDWRRCLGGNRNGSLCDTRIGRVVSVEEVSRG